MPRGRVTSSQHTGIAFIIIFILTSLHPSLPSVYFISFITTSGAIRTPASSSSPSPPCTRRTQSAALSCKVARLRANALSSRTGWVQLRVPRSKTTIDDVGSDFDDERSLLSKRTIDMIFTHTQDSAEESSLSKMVTSMSVSILQGGPTCSHMELSTNNRQEQQPSGDCSHVPLPTPSCLQYFTFHGLFTVTLSQPPA